MLCLSIFHLCSADSNEARLHLKFKSLEESLWRKHLPRPIIHIVNDSNHVWNKHFWVQNNFHTLKKVGMHVRIKDFKIKKIKN